MPARYNRWNTANILPVAFAMWVMLTIWSLFVVTHLVPMLQIGVDEKYLDSDRRSRGFLEAIISHTLIVMMLICYRLVIVTDPGGIPQDLVWRGTQASLNDLLPKDTLLVESKKSGQRRYCKWCDMYKPDRCHHCRSCRTCVLRMDHHCPWIANCVGFCNHKYFMLFVFYATLSAVFVKFSMLESIVQCLTEESTGSHRFFLVFGMTLTALMSLFLVAFFSFHVWLMLKGTTTIEFCEKQHRARSSFATASASYDVGVLENVKAVLGPQPILWLLPISLPEGSGTTFESSDGGSVRIHATSSMSSDFFTSPSKPLVVPTFF